MHRAGKQALTRAHERPNDAPTLQAAGGLDYGLEFGVIDLGDRFGDLEEPIVLHGLPTLLHDAQDLTRVAAPVQLVRRDVEHVAVEHRLLADLPIELRRLDSLRGRQIARNDRPQAVPGGDVGAAYHVIIFCDFVCHDFFF